MSTTLEQMAFERRRSLRWLDQASGVAIVMWALAGAAAVVGLVLALQTAVTGEAFPASWYRNLTLAVWCTLLPVPGQAWAALQAQRRVWLARVAPAGGLQAAMRAFWRTLALSAAIAVLPLLAVAVLVPPPGGLGAFVLFVTGLMAGTVSAVIMVAAAWRGQLRGRWIVPGLAVLASIVFALLPESQWFHWQAAEGPRAGVLVALVLSPVLMHWLLRPALGLAATRQREAGPVPPLRTRAQGHWRAVTERLRYVDGTASLGMLGGLWGQLPQQFINRQPEGLLFMPWGSDFTCAGPWRLLMLTIFAGALLTTPALHWRHLLAPRGALRANLGWRIALTTYLMVIALMTVTLVPVGLGVLVLASDGSQLWARLPALLMSYVPPLLLDIALAAGLATLIRGWAGTQGRAMATLLAIAVVWGLVHLALYGVTGQGAPVLLKRDASYALLILAITACCAWAAARVWRRADLGALMRSSRRRAGASGHET